MQDREWRAVHDLRARLARGGFHPIPVLHRGKGCLMRDWQTYVHHPEVQMQTGYKGRWHTATGVRCHRLCVVDIDVTDPFMAEEIRSMIEHTIGASDFVRYRDHSSKIALFYQHGLGWDGVPRRASRYRLEGGHKLEIYHHGGMQIVVQGEHADSTDARPIWYRWEGRPLWTTPLNGLPEADAPDLDIAVQEVVHNFPPADGAEASLRGEHMPLPEAVRGIASGADFHAATVAIAGHMARDGIHPTIIAEYLNLIYALTPTEALGPERAADHAARRADIARCVRDIARAEAKKAESLYASFFQPGPDPFAWRKSAERADEWRRAKAQAARKSRRSPSQ